MRKSISSHYDINHSLNVHEVDIEYKYGYGVHKIMFVQGSLTAYMYVDIYDIDYTIASVKGLKRDHETDDYDEDDEVIDNCDEDENGGVMMSAEDNHIRITKYSGMQCRTITWSVKVLKKRFLNVLQEIKSKQKH